MKQIKSYLPILRTKQGEFRALANLTSNQKAQFTPMFELRPMTASDLKNKKTIDQHLSKACINIQKNWSESIFFIDIYGIPHSAKLNNGKSPIKFVLDFFENEKINFIPTIGLDREVGYKNEIKLFVNKNDESEICLRLDRSDLELPKKTAAEINSLLKELLIEKKRVHLLVDLRFLHEDSFDSLVDLIVALASEVEINDWKNFTIAGCSMPEDVSIMKTGQPNIVKRKEYVLWKLLCETLPLVGRIPYYSDYTIIHPDKADAIVPGNKIATKIRYTLDDTWVVHRGTRHDNKANKILEYQELSSHVTKNVGFSGKDFSWADNEIHECSLKIKKHCGPGKWVEININRHLAFVAQQIANSSVFS